MAKYQKKKNSMKKIIAIIVAIVLGIALIAGIVALTRPNTKDETIEINPTFTTGALSATTGKYTETEASLYTKEVFDATGLQVEVAFDATVSYQLFYYDEDGAFLAASAVLTENHTAVLPEGTDGARMVITPDWTDVDEDEQVIAWYDVNKYVDQLKLTITNPDYVEEETEDSANVPALELTKVEIGPTYAINLTILSGAELDSVIGLDETGGAVKVYIFDNDKKFVGRVNVSGINLNMREESGDYVTRTVYLSVSTWEDIIPEEGGYALCMPGDTISNSDISQLQSITIEEANV